MCGFGEGRQSLKSTKVYVRVLFKSCLQCYLPLLWRPKPLFWMWGRYSRSFWSSLRSFTPQSCSSSGTMPQQQHSFVPSAPGGFRAFGSFFQYVPGVHISHIPLSLLLQGSEEELQPSLLPHLSIWGSTLSFFFFQMLSAAHLSVSSAGRFDGLKLFLCPLCERVLLGTLTPPLLPSCISKGCLRSSFRAVFACLPSSASIFILFVFLYFFKVWLSSSCKSQLLMITRRDR